MGMGAPVTSLMMPHSAMSWQTGCPGTSWGMALLGSTFMITDQGTPLMPTAVSV